MKNTREMTLDEIGVELFEIREWLRMVLELRAKEYEVGLDSEDSIELLMAEASMKNVERRVKELGEEATLRKKEEGL